MGGCLIIPYLVFDITPSISSILTCHVKLSVADRYIYYSRVKPISFSMLETHSNGLKTGVGPRVEEGIFAQTSGGIFAHLVCFYPSS